MFAKKYSKGQQIVGAALVVLAASRLFGLLVTGAKTLRGWLRPKVEVDAAGLTAKDRFDLYADLEEACEQELTQKTQHYCPTEAS